MDVFDSRKVAHAHSVWCPKALHMVEYRHLRFHPYNPIESIFHVAIHPILAVCRSVLPEETCPSVPRGAPLCVPHPGLSAHHLCGALPDAHASVRPSTTATSRGPHGDRLRARRHSGGAVGEAPGDAYESRYPPATHPPLRAPEAQDPARAGPGRFRLEKRRPLRHAAGRFTSSLSGRGPAGSGSRHRRRLAACASGCEDHQSGSCWGVCGGGYTWRSARQASRLFAPMCWSTCATRSKTRWHATKERCHCWKERGKRRSRPPSVRPRCRKSQPRLWSHLSSTSERRACKTMG